jgi:hypothetical protein
MKNFDTKVNRYQKQLSDSPFKNLVFLIVSTLLGVELVSDIGFWIWSGSTGAESFDRGGGGGGGGEDIEEANIGKGGGIGTDIDVGDVGADFGTDDAIQDTDDFGMDGGVGIDFCVINVDFDESAADVGFETDNGDAGNADDNVAAGSVALSSSSTITFRGGECTSTMLCVLFDCKDGMLSTEELLDLLPLFVIPLCILVSSAKGLRDVNFNVKL